MKKIKIILAALLFPAIVYTQELLLTNTNGPAGGGITGDITINKQGELFAGTYGTYTPGIRTGIYKSTNTGETWQRINTAGEYLQVLSIYTTSTGTIFAGTDWQQGKIYRSTDNGSTWEIKANGFTGEGVWVISEISSTGRILVGDGDSGGIFYSDDSGDNWTKAASGSPLAIAQDDSGRVYFGYWQGIYYSDDNGTTWQDLNFPYELAVSTIISVEGNTIYCGTGYSWYREGDGVFKTTDGGLTWDHIGLNGIKVTSLVIDSLSNDIYAGTYDQGIFRSTDGGNTWQPGDPNFRKDISRLKITSEGYLIAGSEEKHGIYKSTDKGNTFTTVGLPNAFTFNMEPFGENKLILATEAGVIFYDKIGGNWTHLGFPEAAAVTIAENGDIYAAATLNGVSGLYLTTDSGVNWTQVQLPASQTGKVRNALAVNGKIYAAADNLCISSDNGSSWFVSPLITYTDNLASIYVRDNEIWVTGKFNDISGFYKSTDGGISFDLKFDGIPWGHNNLAFTSNGNIYLAFPSDFSGGTGGLFCSADGGDTWVRKSNELTSVVYVDQGDRILAGLTGKLLVSNDYGETWTMFTDITPADFYRDEGGKYFIATTGDGLLEGDIITGLTENKVTPDKYTLAQNYPNPFNPETTIEYTLEKKEHVNLKVYDLLGRELAVLVNEVQEAGSRRVRFAAGELPAGVYFYTLRAGDFVQTKKMCLLK